MPPRKGTTRKGGGKKGARAKATSSAEATSAEEESHTPPPQQLRTPSRVSRLTACNGTPRASAATGAKRTIFTPVAGRKYARGTVDVPETPQRAGTAGDAMRVAVSRTPFTARRGIAEYEAERDPIRTYVRLKPADPARFAGQLPKSLLQVVSDKEVEVVARGGGEEEVCERYLFAGVLPTLAKQPRVFEVCAQPVVRDLFAGFNTLLFTYGITNSGKTHTVQGSGGSPGLLPRSVKAVLDVLDRNGAQGDFAVRPKYATQVEYCSDPRVVAPTFRQAPGEDAWLAGLEQDAGVDAALDDAWAYQLYVSYFEVYNEMVYDLLDLSTLTTVQVGTPDGARRTRRANGRGARRRDEAADPLRMSAAQIAGLPRTALALRSEGGRGNDAFVDGATEVRVRSARDLVRVLIHGQLRRAVHATGLNAGSSRSHAVFQARLVKLRRDAAVVPLGAVPRAAQASVRTMTLVDLAGSERARRTHAQGERLAEAGKINVGLMTLKKCLDVRRFNAADAQAPQLVPYNESKVTRLFQPALEGGAKTVMVVCVDPYEHADADARAETRAVLDFARVASSLVARVRRVPDPPPVLEAVDDSDVAVDSEDEIFFDVDASRKRASAAHEIAHDGAGKRQRRGLGGEWQRLDGQANEPDQANEPNETNEPDQTTSEPNLIIEPDQTTSQPGQSEWLHIARGAQFSFEVAAPRTAPRLGAGLDAAAQREAQRLRAQLAAAQAQAQAQARELDEVASYAEALERAVAALRAQSVAAQARAVRVEEETRREAAAFFVAKIAQVQAQAGARLDAELEVSAAKAAHKLDILARLRALRGESDDSDLEPSTAEVATVSPRTALRRAVSRAASKKANKMGSVSAGEAHELASLRAHIDSLDAQASSQATQLEMVAQARAADRARAEALEAALLDANGRAAALEARLMRHAPAHAAAAELAVTRAHEQERAELLAQITLLKQQLRDADTHSLRARRQWETHELLPVQERLRVAVHEARRVQRDGRDMHVSEALERAERARDDAWAWWTREQERSSQLCAQNDVLMREIRHLRAQLLQLEPPSPRVSVHSEPLSDSDDSFCRVSLHSASALSAVNGGNPLGAVLNANASQASVAAKPLAALDRVISKGGRVLHRNPTARSFAAARDSSDAPSLASPPAREGRAKRVVSRVFQLPGRRHDASAAPHRPYLAGRFANTDSAVGSYSAEVFSFERGGDAAESQSSEQLLAPPPKLRSIVYSGPIVSHKTGGVSVTFTSQEVSDLPLRADPLPELSDEDGQAQGPASVAELPGDVDMAHDTNMPDDVDMASDAETPDKCAMPTGAETPNHRESAPALSEFPSMASLQSTVKKKRKLHAARTVIDIGSPENALDDRMVGAPTPADLRPSLGLPKSAARVSSAALPQENTQPVLFTPVRTRSRGRAATESSAPDSDDPKDSIFTTPMKMLSRLRNRKK